MHKHAQEELTKMYEVFRAVIKDALRLLVQY